MSRVHVSLLPIPVLAVIVAFSACSRQRAEEPTSHVIPPALAFAATPAPATAPAQRPAPAAAPPVAEDAPSAEEIAAFERPVPK